MADVPPERPVHLLAAHANRRAVLMESAPDGTIRLPLLGLLEEIEEHAPVAALLARYLGVAHPILQVLPLGEDSQGQTTDVLVVAEPLAELPAGPAAGAATWVPLGDPRLVGLGGDTAIGPHVTRWLEELATGVVDPRRQRWERPGSLDRARRWMIRQLELAGTPVLGEPTVQQLWAISALLRVETTAGAAFLKSCAWVFDAEPAATEALHRAIPGAVPEVIATDRAEGWLLMRDAGGVPVGSLPVDRWHASLAALASIQQAAAGGLDHLVLEDRGPGALAASLPALFESDDVAAFPDDLGPRFRAAAPRVLDACARLATLGPGPTVIHGDFHPGNVLQAGERVVVIDWSDTALGHPFMDLATWLPRVADVPERRRMVETWLGCWAGAGPRAELEEAVGLALVAGALHQVESYRRIMASLEPGSDSVLAGGGPWFARWALAWLDDGLAATVPRDAH